MATAREKTARITISLPEDEATAFRELAERQGRSLSGQARLAFREAVKEDRRPRGRERGKR